MSSPNDCSVCGGSDPRLTECDTDTHLKPHQPNITIIPEVIPIISWRSSQVKSIIKTDKTCDCVDTSKTPDNMDTTMDSTPRSIMSSGSGVVTSPGSGQARRGQLMVSFSDDDPEEIPGSANQSNDNSTLGSDTPKDSADSSLSGGLSEKCVRKRISFDDDSILEHENVTETSCKDAEVCENAKCIQKLDFDSNDADIEAQPTNPLLRVKRGQSSNKSQNRPTSCENKRISFNEQDVVIPSDTITKTYEHLLRTSARSSSASSNRPKSEEKKRISFDDHDVVIPDDVIYGSTIPQIEFPLQTESCTGDTSQISSKKNRISFDAQDIVIPDFITFESKTNQSELVLPKEGHPSCSSKKNRMSFNDESIIIPAHSDVTESPLLRNVSRSKQRQEKSVSFDESRITIPNYEDEPNLLRGKSHAQLRKNKCVSFDEHRDIIPDASETEHGLLRNAELSKIRRGKCVSFDERRAIIPTTAACDESLLRKTELSRGRKEKCVSFDESNVSVIPNFPTLFPESKVDIASEDPGSIQEKAKSPDVEDKIEPVIIKSLNEAPRRVSRQARYEVEDKDPGRSLSDNTMPVIDSKIESTDNLTNAPICDQNSNVVQSSSSPTKSRRSISFCEKEGQKKPRTPKLLNLKSKSLDYPGLGTCAVTPEDNIKHWIVTSHPLNLPEVKTDEICIKVDASVESQIPQSGIQIERVRSQTGQSDGANKGHSGMRLNTDYPRNSQSENTASSVQSDSFRGSELNSVSNVSSLSVDGSVCRLQDLDSILDVENENCENSILDECLRDSIFDAQDIIPYEESIGEDIIPNEESVAKDIIPNEESVAKDIPNEESVAKDIIPNEESVAKDKIPNKESVAEDTLAFCDHTGTPSAVKRRSGRSSKRMSYKRKSGTVDKRRCFRSSYTDKRKSDGFVITDKTHFIRSKRSSTLSPCFRKIKQRFVDAANIVIYTRRFMPSSKRKRRMPSYNKRVQRFRESQDKTAKQTGVGETQADNIGGAEGDVDEAFTNEPVTPTSDEDKRKFRKSNPGLKLEIPRMRITSQSRLTPEMKSKGTPYPEALQQKNNTPFSSLNNETLENDDSGGQKAGTPYPGIRQRKVGTPYPISADQRVGTPFPKQIEHRLGTPYPDSVDAPDFDSSKQRDEAQNSNSIEVRVSTPFPSATERRIGTPHPNSEHGNVEPQFPNPLEGRVGTPHPKSAGENIEPQFPSPLKQRVSTPHPNSAHEGKEPDFSNPLKQRVGTPHPNSASGNVEPVFPTSDQRVGTPHPGSEKHMKGPYFPNPTGKPVDVAQVFSEEQEDSDNTNLNEDTTCNIQSPTENCSNAAKEPSISNCELETVKISSSTLGSEVKPLSENVRTEHRVTMRCDKRNGQTRRTIVHMDTPHPRIQVDNPISQELTQKQVTVNVPLLKEPCGPLSPKSNVSKCDIDIPTSPVEPDTLYDPSILRRPKGSTSSETSKRHTYHGPYGDLEFDEPVPSLNRFTRPSSARSSRPSSARSSRPSSARSSRPSSDHPTTPKYLLNVPEPILCSIWRKPDTPVPSPIPPGHSEGEGQKQNAEKEAEAVEEVEKPTRVFFLESQITVVEASPDGDDDNLNMFGDGAEFEGVVDVGEIIVDTEYSEKSGSLSKQITVIEKLRKSDTEETLEADGDLESFDNYYCSEQTHDTSFCDNHKKDYMPPDIQSVDTRLNNQVNNSHLCTDHTLDTVSKVLNQCTIQDSGEPHVWGSPGHINYGYQYSNEPDIDFINPFVRTGEPIVELGDSEHVTYHGKIIKMKLFMDLQSQTTWILPAKYKPSGNIGVGTFGQVCSAVDKQTNRPVAIKKLSRPFQSEIHAKRTCREIRMLMHMKHENIIGLLDIFAPTDKFEEFDDVYLVTHLMGADLNNIVKTQRLTDEHVQFLIYQILRGLKYVHSAGIIHRDLKPSNIAVNEDCELRILDFGLARQADDEMTGYVATRWYRAPEIMLSWMHYNQTVDVWSVGCIMAEIITGKPLFPGTDHIDQLSRIMNLVGTPGPDLLNRMTSEEARRYIQSLPNWKKKDFRRIFKSVDGKAIDLIERMLDLDPETRITAEQALSHAYLQAYSDPSDEPVSEPFDSSFEDQDCSIFDWKKIVWQDIHSFVPPPPEDPME